MIIATQLRPGMLIKKDDALFRVVDVSHVTPGKGRGHIQTKLRNLNNNSLYEHRFRPDDKVERAILDTHEMEFLYVDGNSHLFMNTETYEQVSLDEETLGEAVKYLIPNIVVKVGFFEGKPFSVELPHVVELKVTKTEPELKSATAASSNKPATLETGIVVQVPPFVKEGEVIRVDTRDGKYLERAGK